MLLFPFPMLSFCCSTISVFYRFCYLAYLFILNSYLISDLLVVIHKCVLFFCLGWNGNNWSIYTISNFYSRTANFLSGYIICDNMVHIFIYFANGIVYNHIFMLAIQCLQWRFNNIIIIIDWVCYTDVLNNI